MSPKEFELFVKGILDSAAEGLSSYSSEHLEPVAGMDGEFIFDVTARMEILGAKFLVLVECKHEARRVERSAVQILHSKINSVGAQKGMIFSTGGFQSGAVDITEKHGIALVQVVEGKTNWHTRWISGPSEPPPWVEVPAYIGWLIVGNRRQLVATNYLQYIRDFLGFSAGA